MLEMSNNNDVCLFKLMENLYHEWSHKNWNTLPGFLSESVISRGPGNTNLWSPFYFNEYVFIKGSKKAEHQPISEGAPTFPTVFLTKTIMTIMSQLEAIKTSAAIIAWNIQTVMDTASVEFIFTFINVWGIKQK